MLKCNTAVSGAFSLGAFFFSFTCLIKRTQGIDEYATMVNTLDYIACSRIYGDIGQ